MIKFRNILIVFFIWIFPLGSQSPDTVWTRTYGGLQGDYGVAGCQDQQGNLIAVGTTYSFAAQYSDIWLLILDSYGNVIWDSTYGYDLWDYPNDIIRTSDNGLLIAGVCCNNYLNGDLYLVKTDSQGNVEWELTQGDSFYEQGANSVIETSDSQYLVGGFTYSEGAGGSDAWILWLDRNGIILRDTTYGGIYDDLPADLIEDDQGNFILGGQTKSPGGTHTQGWLLMIDHDGNILRDTIFGGIDSDWFESLVLSGDGGCILAGTSISNGPGGFDGWLVKTDSGGHFLWDRTFGGIQSDDFWRVRELADGNIVLTGTTSSYPSQSPDFWVVKTDSQGNLIWSYHWGGDEIDESREIIPINLNEFVIIGSTESFGQGISDLCIFKISEEVGVDEISEWETDNPQNLICSQNILTESIDIIFHNSARGWVNISVYDVSGKLIKVFQDGLLARDSHYFQWNKQNNNGEIIPTGIYFLLVRAGENNYCTKLVITR